MPIWLNFTALCAFLRASLLAREIPEKRGKWAKNSWFWWPTNLCTFFAYNGRHRRFNENLLRFGNFYGFSRYLACRAEKSEKYSFFHACWGFGGLFEKTCKKSIIYVWNLHQMRPIHLDIDRYRSIFDGFHAIWWKFDGT